MPVAWVPKEKHDSTTDHQVQTTGNNGARLPRTNNPMMQENWSEVYANYSRLLHAIYLGSTI